MTEKIKKLNPFYINYSGVKYKESIETFSDIDFDKYDTFIEPFGGTFGFSRYVFIKLNKPTDKKFIIYDNDEELINFYNSLKNMSEIEQKKMFDEYNELLNT